MNSASLSIKYRAVRITLNLLEFAAVALLFLCLTEQPAKAYADPGSGAVLWQLFFASIVSFGFHFRKLRLWFTNRWPRRRDPTT
jgi:hypothetical protein